MIENMNKRCANKNKQVLSGKDSIQSKRFKGRRQTTPPDLLREPVLRFSIVTFGFLLSIVLVMIEFYPAFKGWLNAQNRAVNMAVVPGQVYFRTEFEKGDYFRAGDTRRIIPMPMTDDEKQMRQMNLEPDREIFKYAIDLKFHSTIFIYASVSGIFDSRQQGRDFGRVVAWFSMDGGKAVKESSQVCGKAICPLSTSVFFYYDLPPGKHELVMAALYYGPVKNQDARLKLRFIRHTRSRAGPGIFRNVVKKVPL